MKRGYIEMWLFISLRNISSEQPALPSVAMITGEEAALNPASGQFTGPNTDQRQLPEPQR